MIRRRFTAALAALAILLAGSSARAAYGTSWSNSTAACPLTITISPSAGDILIAAAITDTVGANEIGRASCRERVSSPV